VQHKAAELSLADRIMLDVYDPAERIEYVLQLRSDSQKLAMLAKMAAGLVIPKTALKSFMVERHCYRDK